MAKEYDQKKKIRQERREKKRKGNKWLRKKLKGGLKENPDEAHWTEIDYGPYEVKKKK